MKDNIMKKIILCLMSAVVAIIAITSIFGVVKPNLFRRIADYKNAVKIEYKGSGYEGIKIPDGVKVYFVANIEDLNNDIFDVWVENDDNIQTGNYDRISKEIFILDNMHPYRIKESLRHETSHYYWDKMDDKKIIKDVYGRFCQNQGEFFAYIVGSGQRIVDNFDYIYNEQVVKELDTQ